MPIVTSAPRKSNGKSRFPLPTVLAVAVLVAVACFFIVKPSWKGGDSDAESSFAESSKATGTSASEKAKSDSSAVGKAGVADAKTDSKVAVEEAANPDAEKIEVVVGAEEKKDAPKPMPFGVLSKQYFTNSVENQLEKLGISGRGVAMVLPNKLTQAEVLEILRRPVDIYEDDDEETVAAKERTAAMKQEALKFIEQGGTYDEFVSEMAKISNEEAAMAKSARSEMMRVLKEEGYEAAEAYLEEVNPALKAAGLKEMKIPLPFRVKHQKELERAAKAN